MAKSNGELLNKMEAQAPAERPRNVADEIAGYLKRDSVKEQIASALPKHMTADRLARVVLTTIRTNPTLLECTVPSLMSCTMQAAQLGLEPGLLGHCYFVPFNRKIRGSGSTPDRWVKDVQFIIGYKGLLDLVRRTGDVKEIAAHAIHERDEFQVVYGYESTLKHVPAFGERGAVIGFYAYAQTSDGGRYCEVMSLDEVKAIRDRSKSKDNGPWVTDFAEMGRKTVLRRLCKYLPISIEIADHIGEDERREFKDATSIELNLGERKPATAALDAPLTTIDATFTENEAQPTFGLADTQSDLALELEQ